MKKEHWILISIAIILAMAIGALFMLYFQKPKTVNVPVPVEILIPGKDSLIIKHHYYHYYDTVPAEVRGDTASAIFNNISVFEEDTIEVKSNVVYAYRDSTFSLDQLIDYRKTEKFRVDTLIRNIPVDVVKPVEWYQEPYLHFGLGVLVSLLLFFIGG